MRAVLAILLRGRGRFAALVGTVASGLFLFNDRWWQIDGETALEAVASAMPPLLVAAVFGTALDGREYVGTRNGILPGSPQWRARRLVPISVACALPSLIGVLSLQLTALAATHHIGAAASPQAVLPYVIVALAAGLGMLGQYYLPMFALAPLAVVAGLMLPVVLAAEPDTTLALFTPVDDGAAMPPIVLRDRTVWTQVLIFVLLLASPMWWLRGALARRSRWPGRAVALLSTTALVAGIVVGATADPVRHFERTATAAEVACSPRGTICLWRHHTAALPLAERAWAKVSTVLPQRWSHRPGGAVESGVAAPPGWVSFHLVEVGTDVADVAQQMAMAVAVQDLSCGRADEAAAQRIELLLYRMSSPTTALSRPVERIAHQPPAVQDAWLLAREPTCVG